MVSPFLMYFFAALVIQQFGNALASRTRHLSILQHNPFARKTRNLFLFPSMLISVISSIIITYVPWFNSVFNTAPIPWQYWFYPLIGALGLLLADEARKYVLHARC